MEPRAHYLPPRQRGFFDRGRGPERNVLDHLPKHLHPQVRGKLRRAYAETDPKKALQVLNRFADSLAEQTPIPLARFARALKKRSRSQRLTIPPALSKTYSQPTRSSRLISIAYQVTRNVKR